MWCCQQGGSDRAHFTAGNAEEDFIHRADVQAILLDYYEAIREDAEAEAEYLAEAAEEAAYQARREEGVALRKRNEAQWEAFYVANPSAARTRLLFPPK